MINFTDRIPAKGKENRYKITKSDGSIEYVTLERADDANPVGTPLNKSTFEDMQTELTPVIGTYKGTGNTANKATQTIALGFKPRCVIVFDYRYFRVESGYTMFGMAIEGVSLSAIVGSPYISITDNGFEVTHYYDSSRRAIDLNYENDYYMYIAFR